ncbi:MAG TPA: restriction endonuclease subunit R [Kosmotogaceae bacterium]|nr:restriction endonuclease subunit R [Kosmotogaceae bacterium]
MAHKESPEVERLRRRITELEEENAHLRNLVKKRRSDSSSVSAMLSPSEKIKLFRSLFYGRQDVYATRWEASGGSSGYSPVCSNLWKDGICFKPDMKCSECSNKSYAPLTDRVIYNHLTGKMVVGVYPLLEGDLCRFAALDLDGKNWQSDVTATLELCRSFSIPVGLERSRSGEGCHLWFFFESAIAASLARRLGFSLISRALEKRPQLGLDSYDRLFPNQDSIPRGGLGNLIALPLQGKARQSGNTLFLDDSFQPYEDQWGYLSKIKKMHEETVRELVRRVSRQESAETATLPSRVSMPDKVRISLDSKIRIDKASLSPSVLNRVIRLASFNNPEFFKAQAMRMSTFGKPRIINCADDDESSISLPRGCLEAVINLLENSGTKVEVEDKRYIGKPREMVFQGRLTKEQEAAAAEMLRHDFGILCAPTGAGKTVIAFKIISERQQKTLILVHRRELLRQWQERALEFLQLLPEDIGQIGLGKKEPGEVLDIALIQTLSRNENLLHNLKDYGHIVVDECQHIPAFSFEKVIKMIPAKYVLGLTATPKRRDGHHPIMTMQCGPIRHAISRKAVGFFERTIVPRFTEFTADQHLRTTQIYKLLESDTSRNRLIVNDIIRAVDSGRFCLVLSERVAHLDKLYELLLQSTKNVFKLHGRIPRNERDSALESFKKCSESAALLSTGKYLGEGFDDPRLDTLFLVFPVSWKGVLQQYAGRLHRDYENKHEVRIYDYVDEKIQVLKKMYERRIKGYRAIGYRLMKLM